MRFLGGNHFAPYPEELLEFELSSNFLQQKPPRLHENEKNDPTIGDAEDGRVGRVVDSEVQSRDIVPTDSHTTDEAIVLVIWYSDNHPDNPHNCTTAKKL
jgi:hypothetical protein